MQIDDHRLLLTVVKYAERSMLPPDKIQATFLPLKRSSLIIAASTSAPDSSTTIFIRCCKIKLASIISCS